MPFKVMKERCDQCLFGDNPVVSDARRKQILNQCRKFDSHFVCHKPAALELRGEYKGDTEICCRGFWDANPNGTQLMRIAERLNQVVFVEFEDKS